MKRAIRAALGLYAHSGWAVMVAVHADRAIFRRRIEMTRETGPRAQPYHAAEEMGIAEAEEFLERTRRGAVEMACIAIREAIATLVEQGYRVEAASVLVGSGKPLPLLAKILAAHPLIHTAEGVFYREVLKTASETCGLTVTAVPERETLGRCSAVLATSVDELQTRLVEMGKTVGPPWTRDEKLATAAAVMMLRQSAAR
jgi:hypothetical protein